MDNVLINRMDREDDKNTVVYFMIPSLNIDSQMKVPTDKFMALLAEGGYAGLATYLMEQLDVGLQALLKDGDK